MYPVGRTHWSGAFDTEAEAQNCLKYGKSKFARTMLGVLKITQDNTADKRVKVPLQDFTPQSAIAFIEEKVKAME